MERFPIRRGLIPRNLFEPNRYKIHPKFKYYIKKYRAILIVIAISILVIAYCMNAINPVFLNVIENKAYNIAVKISNNAVHQKLKDVNYSDLVILEKDNNGKITMVAANSYAINQISTDISMIIQRQLEDLEDVYVLMPIGILFGSNILSNTGPKMKIKILPIGTVSTAFKSEFESSGINQTIHRIYVDITCSISIVTPFETKKSQFTDSILVNEVVIVGEIPDTYYNLSGVEEFTAKDTMDLIE